MPPDSGDQARRRQDLSDRSEIPDQPGGKTSPLDVYWRRGVRPVFSAGSSS